MQPLFYLAFKAIFDANNCAKAMQTELSSRLRTLRKQRGVSQAALAEQTNVHFTQISRYERGESKPNAEAITKLATALDTTVDFLMNGTTDDLAENAGLEKEIISRFKQVQNLPSEEKRTVLSLLDAYIAKSQIKELLGA
jgi:transcriptional regulator with XRE-family HTH domain